MLMIFCLGVRIILQKDAHLQNSGEIEVAAWYK